jgi:hypothetical protein
VNFYHDIFWVLDLGDWKFEDFIAGGFGVFLDGEGAHSCWDGGGHREVGLDEVDCMVMEMFLCRVARTMRVKTVDLDLVVLRILRRDIKL